jgi:hypothetical protein
MFPVDNAIRALLPLTTPQSQLKVASRSAGSEDRYLIVSLQGGRWMSIDRQDRNRAYLLTKHPLTPKQPVIVELQTGGMAMVENYSASRLNVVPAMDGEYPLERSGKIFVKGGVLADISGTPGAFAAPSALA